MIDEVPPFTDPVCCETCCYWSRLPPAVSSTRGQCRCHPPTVADRHIGTQACFPVTGELLWCGQHRLMPSGEAGS